MHVSNCSLQTIKKSENHFMWNFDGRKNQVVIICLGYLNEYGLS